ncbi:glycosyltransferase [Pontibacter sp. BT310]|uniref:Glycosyltransferase n=1 Tax=Pontibacter populi TaxID=890055 RepID=A0ABS6XBB3_9BACT|nr:MULTISPECIES: glycosyltransferase family 2 protein [Pontibacter]MBJ6118425.1 glycosyltransferase [Pontibacter sp. BT310]MBR0570853.1 glycosyltransferase [Microvirga sp. STS03]MBW3365279.1 glycosyltransferase [Pontibacter populi]
MDFKLNYNPLITIIIAVYNGEQYIAQTIDSILAQDYKNFELVVIDGGSTDSTCKILEAYQHHFSYFISEVDKGIYDAWNKGIDGAKGDWIAFVGSDDILLSSTLTDYVAHIAAHKLLDYDFISSKIQFVTADLKPKTYFGRAWNWPSHKVEMRVAHVGALHGRELFKRYGKFNPTYKIAGDYELLLRPRKNLKASYLDKLTVLMRQEGLSNTNTKVFDESLRAKILTANRNKLICRLEYFYLISKFYLLRVLR